MSAHPKDTARSRALGTTLLVVALTAASALGWLAWRRSRAPRGEASPSAARSTAADAPVVPVAARGAEASACEVHEEPVVVRGTSLGPLAPAGTTLTARVGYYACHPVARGDLVWFRHAGGAPVAKVARAIPGDRIALREVEGHWRLLVNDEPARTSEGGHYFIDRRARKLLDGYVRGYGGVVPDRAYLLLSDRNERVRDSRHFGLVAHADLVAQLVRSGKAASN